MSKGSASVLREASGQAPSPPEGAAVRCAGLAEVAVVLLIVANAAVLFLLFGMAFLLLFSMGVSAPLAIGGAVLFVCSITVGPALTFFRRR